MLQQTDDATPYRLSHPLAQHVINSALSLSLEDAEVEFDSVEAANAFVPPDFLGREMTEVREFSMSQYWIRGKL